MHSASDVRDAVMGCFLGALVGDATGTAVMPSFFSVPSVGMLQVVCSKCVCVRACVCRCRAGVHTAQAQRC